MKRIQRKRTKGWRMPDNAVYVGRPSKWGNPLKLVGDIIHTMVIHISSPFFCHIFRYDVSSLS